MAIDRVTPIIPLYDHNTSNFILTQKIKQQKCPKVAQNDKRSVQTNAPKSQDFQNVCKTEQIHSFISKLIDAATVIILGSRDKSLTNCVCDAMLRTFLFRMFELFFPFRSILSSEPWCRM